MVLNQAKGTDKRLHIFQYFSSGKVAKQKKQGSPGVRPTKVCLQDTVLMGNISSALEC